MFCLQYFVHKSIWEDLVWLDPNWYKIAWKKIWKSSWKIKYSKPWLQEIWSKFFDLMHSVHKHDHNPNERGHAAAQKLEEQTWKFCSKKSKLKSSLQGDSRHKNYSNSFLKHHLTYSNQKHSFKLQELVTRMQTVSRNFQNRASWFMHTLQFLFIDSCLLWASETNHAN